MPGCRKMISGYLAKPAAALVAAAVIAMAGASPAQAQSMSESAMSLNAVHWPVVGDVRVIALEPVFEEIATLRDVGVSELAWASGRLYAAIGPSASGADTGGAFRLENHVQLAQAEFLQALPASGQTYSAGGGAPLALRSFGTVNTFSAGSFGQLVQLTGQAQNEQMAGYSPIAGGQPVISATPATGFRFLVFGNGAIQLGGDVPPPTITFIDIFDPGKAPPTAGGCGLVGCDDPGNFTLADGVGSPPIQATTILQPSFEGMSYEELLAIGMDFGQDLSGGDGGPSSTGETAATPEPDSGPLVPRMNLTGSEAAIAIGEILTDTEGEREQTTSSLDLNLGNATAAYNAKRKEFETTEKGAALLSSSVPSTEYWAAAHEYASTEWQAYRFATLAKEGYGSRTA